MREYTDSEKEDIERLLALKAKFIIYDEQSDEFSNKLPRFHASVKRMGNVLAFVVTSVVISFHLTYMNSVFESEEVVMYMLIALFLYPTVYFSFERIMLEINGRRFRSGRKFYYLELDQYRSILKKYSGDQDIYNMGKM